MDNALPATDVTLDPTSTVKEPLWRICKDWSAAEITGGEVSENINKELFLSYRSRRKELTQVFLSQINFCGYGPLIEKDVFYNLVNTLTYLLHSP